MVDVFRVFNQQHEICHRRLSNSYFSNLSPWLHLSVMLLNSGIQSIIAIWSFFNFLWNINKTIEHRQTGPYLSATARSLSGLNVPSVSMYRHLPSAPPWSIGSYRMKVHSMTYKVTNLGKQSWCTCISIFMKLLKGCHLGVKELLPGTLLPWCDRAVFFQCGILQTFLWYFLSRCHLQSKEIA